MVNGADAGPTHGVDAYRVFLSRRLESIRPATSAAPDGSFHFGRLLLQGLGGEAEAWRCQHRHPTQGLAFACAETERLSLKALRLSLTVLDGGRSKDPRGEDSKTGPRVTRAGSSSALYALCRLERARRDVAPRRRSEVTRRSSMRSSDWADLPESR
jgi:hypothetical protein